MNAQESNFNFFLIVPPGLEELQICEINDLKLRFFEENKIGANIEILSIEKGGINISGPLEICALINQNLKIPSRLLLRLDSFKCRDFPKLYQKVGKIKWNDWCYQIQRVQSSASDSTLFDSRKIEKTVNESIVDFFKKNPAKKNKHQNAVHPQVFIRFQNDICTVSLDTTGERLGKRGLKKGAHQSPLRENLAYACLYSLVLKLKREGHPAPYTLIDPMCGSGTFLSEAVTREIPRDFSYNYIPLLEKIKNNSTKRFWFNSYPLNLGVKRLWGFDKDARALASANLNLEQINKLSNNDFDVKIEHEDFFNKDTIFTADKNEVVILISNPPYGKRLEIDSPKQQYLNSFIAEAKKKFNPIFTGILFLNISKSITPTLIFDHGGLDVGFTIHT